ncbi:MAG: BglII/BstYI family type II restriction endonuclease [Nitrospirota bacterium]
MGGKLRFVNDSSLKEFLLRHSDADDIEEVEDKYDRECPPEIRGEFRQRLRQWFSHYDEKGPESVARKLGKLVRLLDKLESVEDDTDEDVGGDDAPAWLESMSINFKNGEEHVANISKTIHRDMIKLAEEMRRVKSAENLKAKLDSYFIDNDWEEEHAFSANRGWRMDFMKDQIGIEIELGSSREMCFRDFIRFMVLKKRERIKAGVLIVYMDSDSVANRNTSATSQNEGRSNPYFTLEYMNDVFEEFGDVIDVPIWCIGV